MNTKKISIDIPSESVLKRVLTTPTFNRLSRVKLIVGKNIETVNHAQFSDMQRLYPLLGIKITQPPIK
tara:strand:- start:515 stop:718 length:204 start_codon:yes stop_codon:yes gene_type:complete